MVKLKTGSEDEAVNITDSISNTINDIATFRKFQILDELETLANYEPDWDNPKEEKWGFLLSREHGRERILYFYTNHFQHIGTVYFRTKAEAKNAVDIVRESRILKYLFNIYL